MIKRFFLFFTLLGLYFFRVYALPNYWYANYDIKPYWNDMIDIFAKLKAYDNSGKKPSEELFSKLYKDFEKLFPKLPQTPDYKVVYETCLMQVKGLSEGFDGGLYMDFKSQCFYPLQNIIKEIERKYTVSVKIIAAPKMGPAPLTVTFKAIASDPSLATIPTKNYFWYYTDSNGVEKAIGQGPNVVYTFLKPNTYVVHLVVRSINKDKGILDGEKTVDIVVQPPIANIVLYANMRRLTENFITKFGKSEAEKGIIFDASATTSNGATKIKEYFFTVKDMKGNTVYSYKGTGQPGSFKVRLTKEGKYYVTLKIINNLGESIEKTYEIVISDPIAIIKITPTMGNTSTRFNFDASLSYSITSKIKTYKWIIIDPNGNILFQTESKSFSKKFIQPGNYTIKLTVIDEQGNANEDVRKLYVDSTPPVPQFTIRPVEGWKYPSEFIFDAGGSYDIDVVHGVDSLKYEWSFSNRGNVKVKYFDNGRKILASFNSPGEYVVTLRVIDSYGKSAEISKKVKVVSTLRPKLFINPIGAHIGQNIVFTVETNKPVAYYKWDFGDGTILKTSSNTVYHKYNKAGTYKVKLEVYTPSGEYNEVTRYVFVSQVGQPIVIYKVFSNNEEILPKDICSVKIVDPKTGKKIIKNFKAYPVVRYQSIILDASYSVNVKGDKDNLEIYFKLPNGKIIKKDKIRDIRFDELGCKRIDIYVKDNNVYKIAKRRVRFKVKDALPELKGLYLQFPQYGNMISTSFSQKLQDNIFKVSYDPLIVKVVAREPRDPDGQIAYFKWYYYRDGDIDNPIDVKITPGNIPYAVFSVPRIPGKYLFGVELCDNDRKCVKSEDIIGNGPVVFFPPSDSNPNIPIVNLKVSPVDVKVGEVVNFDIDTYVVGDEKNFKREKVIKIDFDGDGIYDLITKKTKVTHIYKKPGVYKPKVKVVFRGYAGIGYGPKIYVRKGLKASFLYDKFDRYILVRDISIGDIIRRELCFDLKKCKKDKNYLVVDRTVTSFKYKTYGDKIVYLRVKDKYGDVDSYFKKIDIVKDNNNKLFLSVPSVKSGNIYVGNSLNNTVSYYIINTGCVADPDISTDENSDGDPSNDRILVPFKVYNITYHPKSPYTYFRIRCSGNIQKDLRINFIDFEDMIPQKYKDVVKRIDKLLSILSQYNGEFYETLKSLLTNLRKNLSDSLERDSIVFQIKELIDDNNQEIPENIKVDLNYIINKLSDKAVKAAFGDTQYEQAKQEILLILSDKEAEIKSIFEKIETTNPSPEQIKQYLSEILKYGSQDLKAGIIEEADYNILLQDICTILKYYNIPSEKCGTAKAVSKNNSSSSNTSSLVFTIVKYLLIIVAVLVFLFILLVVIFAIKAKVSEESTEDKNNS